MKLTKRQCTVEQIIPKLANAAGVTGKLKVHDSIHWVGLINACKAQAEKVAFWGLYFLLADERYKSSFYSSHYYACIVRENEL